MRRNLTKRLLLNRYFIERKHIAFLLLALCTMPVHGQTHNLRLDWSDTANPNGVWSYRQGTSVLPSDTYPAGDFSLSQPAWLGTSPAVWLKTQSNGAGIDTQIGDVVTHSVSSNITNIVWTSPSTGLFDINGSVWMVREIGRSNNWFLRLNGTLLSMGSLASGDEFDRANPFNLDAGSGGVVNNLAIITGDQIELSFQATGTGVGDYVGVELVIAAVPEPSTILLTSVSAVGFGIYLWRRKRSQGESA